MNKIIILVLILTCHSFYNLIAQNQLVISLNNGQTVTHAVSEIRSIKFGDYTMYVYHYDDTSEQYIISELSQYSFTTENVSTGDINPKDIISLFIFHNSSANSIDVTYNNEKNERIQIELQDVSGRNLGVLHNGFHCGKHTYSQSISLTKGIYFTRVTGDKGIITKPFIVQ